MSRELRIDDPGSTDEDVLSMYGYDNPDEVGHEHEPGPDDHQVAIELPSELVLAGVDNGDRMVVFRTSATSESNPGAETEADTQSDDPETMIELAERDKPNHKQIGYELMLTRNELAQLVANRRREGYTARWTKKEDAQRYEELKEQYDELFLQKISFVSEENREGFKKSEFQKLNDAEEAFRTNDKEKIALLRTSGPDHYVDALAEESAKRDAEELEQNGFINKSLEWASDKRDDVLENWAEYSNKKKLGITVGATALTAATVAMLPIGGIVAGFSAGVGAGGAVGTGIIKTASSALRKTFMHNLNSVSRERNRGSIIGDTTPVDATLEDNTANATDIIAILDKTIEADTIDNKRTIRKVGYAALRGVVTGAAAGAAIGAAAGWIKDQLEGTEIVGRFVDSVRGSVGSSEETATDTVNDPTIEMDVDGVVPSMGPQVDIQPEEIETSIDTDELAEADRTGDSVETETDAEPETIDVEETPEVIEETPEVIEETPEVIEETPEVIEETPEVIEETPEVIEETPEVIEETPEVIEAIEEPQAPEEVLEPETSQLAVDPREGFQKAFKDQYGLTDAQSWQAYLAVKPHLDNQIGVYLENGDYRISAPGTLQLNENAAQALKDFLEDIDEDELDEAA